VVIVPCAAVGLFAWDQRTEINPQIGYGGEELREHPFKFIGEKKPWLQTSVIPPANCWYRRQVIERGALGHSPDPYLHPIISPAKVKMKMSLILSSFCWEVSGIVQRRKGVHIRCFYNRSSCSGFNLWGFWYLCYLNCIESGASSFSLLPPVLRFLWVLFSKLAFTNPSDPEKMIRLTTYPVCTCKLFPLEFEKKI
jgi:hypothetical protein